MMLHVASKINSLIIDGPVIRYVNTGAQLCLTAAQLFIVLTLNYLPSHCRLVGNTVDKKITSLILSVL